MAISALSPGISALPPISNLNPLKQTAGISVSNKIKTMPWIENNVRKIDQMTLEFLHGKKDIIQTSSEISKAFTQIEVLMNVISRGVESAKQVINMQV